MSTGTIDQVQKQQSARRDENRSKKSESAYHSHDGGPGQRMSNFSRSLKELVGARGFEPRTSCAQGRRLKLAKHPIVNAVEHFAQFTVVGSVVSDLLFSIACTMLAIRKASSLPVAIFFCSSAG